MSLISPADGAIARRVSSAASGERPQRADRQVGRADAAARACAEEALDATILERVEADPGEHAAVAQQLPGERQRPIELVELVVDGDPQRLEDALGRMAAREARGRGDRRDDRLDQVERRLDRRSLAAADDRAGDRACVALVAEVAQGARQLRSSQSLTISRAVNSWSGSMRMSSGAS